MQLFPYSHSATGRVSSLGRGVASPGATPAIATVTVDAPASASLEKGGQRRLHDVGRALHTLLREHDIPATWGLSEPTRSPLAGDLRSAAQRGASLEVALRLDGLTSRPGAIRSLLAAALSQSLRQAALSCAEISTLFAEASLVRNHYDLLVKRGFTALRDTGTTRGRPGQINLPRRLRYGLWELPIAHRLPEDGVVSGVNKRIPTARAGTVAPTQTGVLHVSVDLRRLMSGDRTAWRVLEKSLRRLARLRAERGMRVECMRSLTFRLTKRPAAAPQRSILRRAA